MLLKLRYFFYKRKRNLNILRFRKANFFKYIGRTGRVFVFPYAVY